MMRLLLIEDETELATILADYLAREGMGVELLADGARAASVILGGQWDLVLLDLGLPGADGIDICREVRARSNVPIIILTARVEEVDRLLGLEVGADDYICKPYSPREVVARVKTVLRRAGADGRAAIAGQFVLDEGKLSVSLGQQTAVLTLLEWRILAALQQASGQILSREQIMNHAYTDHRIVNDRTIDSHINKLRKKLLALSGEDPVCSVYGAGYRLERLSASEKNIALG